MKNLLQNYQCYDIFFTPIFWKQLCKRCFEKARYIIPVLCTAPLGLQNSCNPVSHTLHQIPTICLQKRIPLLGQEGSNQCSSTLEIHGQIDKISIISCVDLLCIHKQLIRTFPKHHLPFGGKSVMLAGTAPPPGKDWRLVRVL